MIRSGMYTLSINRNACVLRSVGGGVYVYAVQDMHIIDCCDTYIFQRSIGRRVDVKAA